MTEYPASRSPVRGLLYVQQNVLEIGGSALAHSHGGEVLSSLFDASGFGLPLLEALLPIKQKQRSKQKPSYFRGVSMMYIHSEIPTKGVQRSSEQ